MYDAAKGETLAWYEAEISETKRLIGCCGLEEHEEVANRTAALASLETARASYLEALTKSP